MTDNEILLFHELFDNLKTYVEKKSDLEEATDQLIDLFDDHGFSMEESVLELRGYSKTIDYCLEAKYDIEDEEQDDEELFDQNY